MKEVKKMQQFWPVTSLMDHKASVLKNSRKNYLNAVKLTLWS